MRNKSKLENMDSEENSSKYHTGKKCIEKDCENPAGTAWSPYWCKFCNLARMNKINKSLEQILKSFK